MGYRSSYRNETASDAETGVTTSRAANRTAADSTAATGGWSRQATLEETEAHFGMEVPDKDTVFRLQRLEAMNTTERVRGWVDEGMTVEDMGNPPRMDAFRERQAERPPEVPTNIERQNSRSVQRSEKAAGETGRHGETGVPDPVRDVISSTGRSLDPSIQRVMEDRMGDSFGDVQVHTGPTATSACESINARAFTVGTHIAFNSGEYDPNSAEGQHVLAHELAHVRQQTGGAVSMLPQEGVELEIDPDPQLEREAEETAQQVMEGGTLGIQRLADTEVHIQRAGLGSLASTKSTWSRGADAGTATPSTNDGVDLVADDVTADPEALADEVQEIKANQAKLFAEMAPDSAGSKVAKSSAKGAVGAVGGLIGAAAGSALLPGIGTFGGAAVGQEMAKGIAGDVTKTLTGSAYEKGSEVVSGKAGDAKEYVDQLVERKLKKYLNKSDTGSDDTKF